MTDAVMNQAEASAGSGGADEEKKADDTSGEKTDVEEGAEADDDAAEPASNGMIRFHDSNSP